MTEEHRQQNRYGYGLTLSLRGFEPQIARTLHCRGVERSKPGRFRNARRVRYNSSLPIDENAERYVALNFLGIQRRRIAERQFLVEHHRSDVRLPANCLKWKP